MIWGRNEWVFITHLATGDLEAYLRLSTKEAARTDHCHSMRRTANEPQALFGSGVKGAALSLPVSYWSGDDGCLLKHVSGERYEVSDASSAAGMVETSISTLRFSLMGCCEILCSHTLLISRYCQGSQESFILSCVTPLRRKSTSGGTSMRLQDDLPSYVRAVHLAALSMWKLYDRLCKSCMDTWSTCSHVLGAEWLYFHPESDWSYRLKCRIQPLRPCPQWFAEE